MSALDDAVAAFERLLDASTAVDRAIAQGAAATAVRERSRDVERAAMALAEAVRFLPADRHLEYRERTDRLLVERTPRDVAR